MIPLQKLDKIKLEPASLRGDSDPPLSGKEDSVQEHFCLHAELLVPTPETVIFLSHYIATIGWVKGSGES